MSQRVNTAHFKTARRACPICGKVSDFPLRQPTCSNDCGAKLRRAKAFLDLGISLEEVSKLLSAKEPTESRKFKGDQATVTKITDEHVRTLPDLIRVCEIDTTTWEITEWECTKWEMAAKFGKRGEERLVGKQLFRVWARMKLNRPLMVARDEIAAMKACAKKWAPKHRRTTRPASDGKIMAEISIVDHHFGALAWSRETGWEDWDLPKALGSYRCAFADLLSRVAEQNPAEILFVIGNDLLTTDNRAGTTEMGTPQDVDSRYQKTFAAVRELYVELIAEARKVAPVMAYMVPGNHDALGVWHLGDSLWCWFQHQDDVRIQNEPTPRKYKRWGKVLLGFAHGKYLKREGENFGNLMAAEAGPALAAAVYKEFHLGHWHRMQAKEFNGFRIRVLPSMVPATAWSSELGMVGNLRSSEAYLWHKERGLLGTVVHTIPPACHHWKVA